jgi:hypothetical protein
VAPVRKKSVPRNVRRTEPRKQEVIVPPAAPRRRAAAARASRRIAEDGKGPRERLVPSRFEFRDLDPQRRCGPDTSVLQLIRVDEQKGEDRIAHLVYEDRRYGWYCEHGRGCPAVARAQRHARERARDGAHGLDDDGRMRA